MPAERHTRAPSQKPSTRTAALCCQCACHTLGFTHMRPCRTRTCTEEARAIMDTKRGAHSQSVRQIEPPPTIRNPTLPAGCTKPRRKGKLLGVQASVQALSPSCQGGGWRADGRLPSAGRRANGKRRRFSPDPLLPLPAAQARIGHHSMLL